MVKLFSIKDGAFLKDVQNSEAQLNRFLSKNWEHFFPQYIFIKSEFPLSGIVRTSGSSGRIDILAFNPCSKKFVVFELKRDSSRNIRSQAEDYRHTINRDFHKIYNDCIDEHEAQLPRPKAIIQDGIETVLIANAFSFTDIEIANKFKDEITLMRYSWFENDLLFIEYLNNAPIEMPLTVKQAQFDVEVSKVIETKHSAINLSDDILYIHGRNNVKAYGHRMPGGQFKVHKGSTVSKEITQKSTPKNAKSQREKCEKNGVIENGKFTTDYTFSSISLAAEVILGGSLNGNTVWKNNPV